MIERRKKQRNKRSKELKRKGEEKEGGRVALNP